MKSKLIGLVIRRLGGKEAAQMWSWLNGKKLAIGLTIEAAGHILEAAVPYVEPVFTALGASAQATAQAVKLVGWLVTALGAGHKFVKEF